MKHLEPRRLMPAHIGDERLELARLVELSRLVVAAQHETLARERPREEWIKHSMGMKHSMWSLKTRERCHVPRKSARENAWVCVCRVAVFSKRDRSKSISVSRVSSNFPIRVPFSPYVATPFLPYVRNQILFSLLSNPSVRLGVGRGWVSRVFLLSFPIVGFFPFRV